MIADIDVPSPVRVSRQGTPRARLSENARESARYDAVLVARFNAGDAAAFDEIIERHRAKLAAFAYTILRNHADAEEIAQDALVRAHRRLEGFRGTCSLATWLHTIALNLSRNRYWYYFRRRRQVTQSLDAALSEDNPGSLVDLAASAAPNPMQEATTREFSDVVAACIARLLPSHREILNRRIVDDCSYDEIAVALGISLGTVKSRINRARENLRARLAIVCPEFTRESALRDWFEGARLASHWRQAG